MFIEPLEPRIAPAALTAKLLGGVLKIVGDPVGSNVSIGQTGDSIEVKDNGVLLGTFDAVKSIDLRTEGAVAIAISLTGSGLPGSCKIAVKGAATVGFTNGSRISGALTFTGDAAEQTFSLFTNVTVEKGIVCKAGTGNDTLTINSGCNIPGNVTTAAVETVNFGGSGGGVFVGGNVAISNAGGTLPVIIHTVDDEGITIGGGLKYVGGKSDDSVFLVALITKGISFVDVRGNSALGLSEFSVVEGSVSMTSGGGSDLFNIGRGRVDGNVTLNLGGGNNIIDYGVSGEVTIGGNFTVICTDGSDTLESFGGALNVAKNITLLLGNGANVVTASIAGTGTKLTVITGNGLDNVSIVGTGTTLAALISLGAGNDTLAGTLLRTVKSATFDGGAGVDHFVENTIVADPFLLRSFEDFT